MAKTRMNISVLMASRGARFRQLLTRSGNDIEYRISKVRNECNLEMPGGRVAYLTGAVDIWHRWIVTSNRDIYAGRLAEETGVAKDSILSQVRKKRARQEKTREQKEFQEFQQQAVGLKDTVNPEKYKHLRAAGRRGLNCLFTAFHRGWEEVSGKLPSNKFVTSFNSRVYETFCGWWKGNLQFRRILMNIYDCENDCRLCE
ncbi:MAG: hypothetical protein ACLSB9_16560 [Hydrogeniiclostridium mannosilyticum]